jgi:hypothetical protein
LVEVGDVLHRVGITGNLLRLGFGDWGGRCGFLGCKTGITAVFEANSDDLPPAARRLRLPPGGELIAEQSQTERRDQKRVSPAAYETDLIVRLRQQIALILQQLKLQVSIL